MDPGWLPNPFDTIAIPVDTWITAGVEWLVANYRDVFQAIKKPVAVIMEAFEAALRGTPPTFIILAFSLVAWQFASGRLAAVVAGALFAIGFIGAWDQAMTSLAVLLSAVTLSVLFGLPLGVLASKFGGFWALLRPVLDFMQTIPSFVYLVPVIMLFGLGNVPGIIITSIYASPPLIRLTNLGLRQVRTDMVEAAAAFGSTPLQTLVRIELPLALPTIMTGLNQTILMALAMSVVAAMISVAGLGRLVLIGITQLDQAGAATGGLGIVLLAIVVDRITQAFGRTRRDRGHKGLMEVGPLGFVVRRIGRRPPGSANSSK